MRRRSILTLTGGAALGVALPARTQAQRLVRIGFLGATTAAGYASRLESLRSGLHAIGYTEGQNISIEVRWAQGKYERLPELVAELVRLKIDVIVTHGTPGTRAAKIGATSIPIVMATCGDVVASGIVASLSRPGGNVTGKTFFSPELTGKRLELLKEAAPRTTRVGVLLNPDNPFMEFSAGPAAQAIKNAAARMKIEIQPLEARSSDEFGAVFAAMAKSRIEAVEVLEDGLFIANAKGIAELAAKTGIPSAGWKEFAEGGGTIGFGVNFLEQFRRAAFFVDKILKGARPGDLPIEQPTKFEFVVNLKTAKALGIIIPQSLLLRADEVIQ